MAKTLARLTRKFNKLFIIEYRMNTQSKCLLPGR